MTYEEYKKEVFERRPDVNVEYDRLGSPLTAGDLRGMDGCPVWVEFDDGSGGLWGIVHITIFDQIVFANGLHCTIGHPYYSKKWKAYRYPPANMREIVHCLGCKTCENCVYCGTSEYVNPCFRCMQSEDMKYFKPAAYCRNCGSPLTQEARVIFEDRIKRCIR